jgi:glycosyltransferase involved in cell wall biosynthesis
MLVSAGIAGDKISVVYDGVAVPDAPARPERIVALESADPMKGTALVRAAAENRFAVHFTSDLDRDLRDASLFLYITHAEGLGSAALLAMAWGVPVVASRIGGLPEIVQDRRTGILTDNDPDAIAQAVAWALDHREELAANARETVAGHFTVGKMVERTTAVYRKVLAC